MLINSLIVTLVLPKENSIFVWHVCPKTLWICSRQQQGLSGFLYPLIKYARKTEITLLWVLWFESFKCVQLNDSLIQTLVQWMRENIGHDWTKWFAASKTGSLKENGVNLSLTQWMTERFTDSDAELQKEKGTNDEWNFSNPILFVFLWFTVFTLRF